MDDNKLYKITKVEVQKHNKNRYSIYLDGEYSFSVSEDVLVRYGLLKGTELESSFIEEVLIDEEKTKAKSVALRYLGYRMRSKKEVADKLREKGYDDFVEDVIDYLESNGYVNDLEFAISYCNDKSRLSGFGGNRLRLELAKKGIKNEDIAAAIEQTLDEDRERESAKVMALKKINGSYRNDSDQDKYRKTYAYLYRKGFSLDIVRAVLKEVL